jgi:hypothetical protein
MILLGDFVTGLSFLIEDANNEAERRSLTILSDKEEEEITNNVVMLATAFLEETGDLPQPEDINNLLDPDRMNDLAERTKGKKNVKILRSAARHLEKQSGSGNVGFLAKRFESKDITKTRPILIRTSPIRGIRDFKRRRNIIDQALQRKEEDFTPILGELDDRSSICPRCSLLDSVRRVFARMLSR